jgi:cobalt-zinc-cadmium resistance protein CzcA
MMLDCRTKKSLPDGVYINGFLERSELVAKLLLQLLRTHFRLLNRDFVVVLLLGNYWD